MTTFPVPSLSEIELHAPARLRLAVISDLHIHHDVKTYADNSNYVQNMPSNDYRINPVVALNELIDRRQLTADYLVCCGDITDKAHPGALAHGWDVLGEIADRLKAKTVLGSAGNHDVDSRFSYSKYDAKGNAMRLQPDFPVADRALANQYWSRHYCIIRGANYQIVLLNSAAYHGEGAAFPITRRDSDTHERTASTAKPEYFHGRVSDETIASLEQDLAGHNYPVNILVCHHHPTRIDAVPDDDYSAMENGEALVALLSEPGRGKWVIIHGHRHVAVVQRPGGSAPNAGPLAFCAGSFGKVLPAGWPSQNQFYTLDILTDPNSVGQSLACEFNAWTWIRNGSGWQPSRFDEKLPGRGGFGYVGEVNALAAQVDGLLVPTSPAMTYEQVVASVPSLRYLAPGDWQHLKASLTGLNVRISEDSDDGELTFIRRAASA